MSTIIFNLPQQLVGPFPVNAPFVSPNFTVPANTTSISVVFNVSAADLADATKTFNVSIVKVVNGDFIAGFSWQGGSLGKDGVTFSQPSIQFTVSQLAGQQIEAIISMPLSITLGLTITALP